MSDKEKKREEKYKEYIKQRARTEILMEALTKKLRRDIESEKRKIRKSLVSSEKSPQSKNK